MRAVVLIVCAGCFSKPTAPMIDDLDARPGSCAWSPPIQLQGPGTPVNGPWLSDDEKKLWFVRVDGVHSIYTAQSSDGINFINAQQGPFPVAVAADDDPFQDSAGHVWFGREDINGKAIVEYDGMQQIVHGDLAGFVEPSLTADRRTLALAYNAGNSIYRIAIAKRASPDVPFPMPLPLDYVGSAQSPSISADGSTVMFTNGTGTNLRIYEARIDQANLVNAHEVGSFQTPSGDLYFDPHQSTDGKTLTFARATSASGLMEIRLWKSKCE